MDSGAHILVVDDDREIRTLLERYLVSQSFRVSTAGDGRAMEACLATSKIDLVVLDVMLPDASGLDLCRALRKDAAPPVILLTALKEDVDRIIGLELGADDYMGKPFNPRELVARIRAVLRRVAEREAPAVPGFRCFHFAGLTADPASRLVTGAAGQTVPLTAAEFELLLAFLERPGRMLSRNQLLDITQGRDAAPFGRSVDVLISRLRRKLGEASGVPLFKTQRNGGYQLIVPVETAEGRA
ncbi:MULTISPECIES: response regulator transcription factor [Rhodomicrobium]|uniref:response regulator n=1 Tax=Rhodomicrobium TaxID=1068 RepID=UPI001FDA52D7|nr:MULTISPECIES: response regulator transcription factor [Rhodomicrobium]